MGCDVGRGFLGGVPVGWGVWVWRKVEIRVK
jgi:hypothetical protein